MKKVESICNQLWGWMQTRIDLLDLTPEEAIAVHEDLSASHLEVVEDIINSEKPTWEDSPEDYMGDDDSDDFDMGYDDVDELEDEDD